MKKTNAQKIRETIEAHGKDTAFWNTFDAYAMVIGTDKWDQAIALLPEPVKQIAEQDGFDCNLDFDFWPGISTISLSLTRKDESAEAIYDEYCNGEAQSAYLECLRLLEQAMIDVVHADKEYADFSRALDLAYSDEPEETEDE